MTLCEWLLFMLQTPCPRQSQVLICHGISRMCKFNTYTCTCTAICSRAWMNSLSWEHHPCLGQSKVSNVSDNMNYLTTHGILHHVLENQSFITSHLCLYCPINFMVFRSKEHHVSQHMVRVSQNMVKYAMCGEVVHVVWDIGHVVWDIGYFWLPETRMMFLR